jgi:V-type H+-transporting ATPase subunit F
MALKEPKGALIGVIGDEDTVTGFLLAGVGNVDARRKSNFLIVDNSETPSSC